jgi:hypothetical protein
MANPVASHVVTIQLRLPWWLPAYIGALKFFQDCGMLTVDADAAAAFVARHIKVIAWPASKLKTAYFG